MFSEKGRFNSDIMTNKRRFEFWPISIHKNKQFLVNHSWFQKYIYHEWHKLNQADWCLLTSIPTIMQIVFAPHWRQYVEVDGKNSQRERVGILFS